MASNYLSTAVGKRTIQQLVKLINQPTDVAGNALASALIEAAAKGDGLRLIDVLEAYPLPSIPVNVRCRLTAAFVDPGVQSSEQLYARLTDLEGLQAGADLQVAAQPGSTGFEQVSFSFKGRVVNSIKAGVYLPKTATASTQALLVVLAPGLNTDMNARYVGRPGQSWLCGCISRLSPSPALDTMTAAIEGTGAIPPANAWYRQPITVSELIDQVEKRWGNGSTHSGSASSASLWVATRSRPRGPNWTGPTGARM